MLVALQPRGTGFWTAQRRQDSLINKQEKKEGEFDDNLFFGLI